jgi:hypothetical protein
MIVVGRGGVVCGVNVWPVVWQQRKSGLWVADPQEPVHNLAVGSGRNLIRDLLDGDSVNGVTHFAVGTGTTAVVDNDTTLGTQVFRDVTTVRTSTAQKLEVQYFLGTGDANGNTLAEIGLFNAASAGTMYARVILASTIVKDATKAVTFTWDLTFATP